MQLLHRKVIFFDTHRLSLAHPCWRSSQLYSTPRIDIQCCECPVCKQPLQTAVAPRYHFVVPDVRRIHRPRRCRPLKASRWMVGDYQTRSSPTIHRWNWRIPNAMGAPWRTWGLGGGSQKYVHHLKQVLKYIKL